MHDLLNMNYSRNLRSYDFMTQENLEKESIAQIYKLVIFLTFLISLNHNSFFLFIFFKRILGTW